MRPASLFFDDPAYLRTIVAEDGSRASAAEAAGAARLAACPRGALVLDAAAGNGRHALPLARTGRRVVALDESRLLLNAGRCAAGAAAWPRFVHGSYTALPFAAARFDAVLCLGTSLGYLGVDGDRAALREFRRVLVPGGRLVIETLHREQLDAGFAAHQDRELPGGATLRYDRVFDPARGVLHEAQRLKDDAGWGPARAYDMRVYGIGELGAMLGHAGFGDTRWYASLSGAGSPTPMSALVVVARAPRAPAPPGPGATSHLAPANR
jgi:SAM-dependent methyltransferase